MTIQSLQSLDHDSELLLFELSNFNKSSPFESFHFTAHDGVVHNGISYLPLACSIEGLEVTSEGQLPTPTLAVSDATTEDSQIITGLIDYYGDGLVGANIKIIQILRKHLDDGTEPNPAATKPIQKFQISHPKELVAGIGVVFELTTPLELLETKLPTQLCLNRCQARYRHPLECGYSGTSEWNMNNTPVPFGDPQAACAKTIGACELRFGANAVLPMLAFPALTRIG